MYWGHAAWTLGRTRRGAEAAVEGGVCGTEAPGLPRPSPLEFCPCIPLGFLRPVPEAEGSKSASPAGSDFLSPNERSQATRPSAPGADPSEPGLTG